MMKSADSEFIFSHVLTLATATTFTTSNTQSPLIHFNGCKICSVFLTFNRSVARLIHIRTRAVVINAWKSKQIFNVRLSSLSRRPKIHAAHWIRKLIVFYVQIWWKTPWKSARDERRNERKRREARTHKTLTNFIIVYLFCLSWLSVRKNFCFFLSLSSRVQLHAYNNLFQVRFGVSSALNEMKSLQSLHSCAKCEWWERENEKGNLDFVIESIFDGKRRR